MIFAGKACMLGIKIGELEVNGSRPAHITAFGIELPGQKGMDDCKGKNDGQESNGDGHRRR